jgi:hypothetical protein
MTAVATGRRQWISSSASAVDQRPVFSRACGIVLDVSRFRDAHVIAIVIVLGSITRLDMRLMGLIWRERPVTEVAAEMLPWTWTSFVIAAVFGLMLWMSKPLTYFGSHSSI